MPRAPGVLLGWPIILVRAGLWDSYAYTTDEYVKYIAYFMETNVKRMDPSNPSGQTVVPCYFRARNQRG